MSSGGVRLQAGGWNSAMTGLSIKARLYLNLAVLATALIVVCGVGLSAFNDSEQRLKQLYSEGLISISQVDEIYQRSLSHAAQLQALVSFFRFDGAVASSSVERSYATPATSETGDLTRAA
jgi:hypothetical protein